MTRTLRDRTPLQSAAQPSQGHTQQTHTQSTSLMANMYTQRTHTHTHTHTQSTPLMANMYTQYTQRTHTHTHNQPHSWLICIQQALQVRNSCNWCRTLSFLDCPSFYPAYQTTDCSLCSAPLQAAKLNWLTSFALLHSAFFWCHCECVCVYVRLCRGEECLWVCMCVCMCVCVCVCVCRGGECMWVVTLVWACAYVCVHVCVSVCLCVEGKDVCGW